MKHVPYTTPKFGEEAFNCPYCGAYAEQVWGEIRFLRRGTYIPTDNDGGAATCTRCSAVSYWFNDKMYIPSGGNAPIPNPDLPEDVKLDYSEASEIVNASPRGAAALLRLAIQKLCKELGESGKNINGDIAKLVEKGLPVKVQQALDAVRVIGNEAVHPGQLDLEDDAVTATALFGLINFIAEKMISEPNEVERVYSLLPKNKREAIEKRDGNES